MATLDFNGAEVQKSDTIPAGTIAPVRLTIRPGGKGEGGWLTASKSSDNLMLDCEFTVTGGPYAKRKFWGKLVVEGSEKAAAITGSTLRGILESARGIKSTDISDTAKAARVVAGYSDFDGLEFVGKIGIEKSDGYADKNKLQVAVTPDMSGYANAGAATASSNGGAAPAASASRQKPAAATGKPAWAQ